MSSLVEIDGSYGEGGGQILRTALALSAITKIPARITKIRAGRENPGLAPQHLTGVLAAASVCAAEVRGAEIGSTELEFVPRAGATVRDRYEFDVAEASRGGSAGSVTLVLQTILLPLAFSGRRVEARVRGGTHVAWSPPFDHFSDVFLPAVSKMGLLAGCSLEAWGFYPVGGGEVKAVISGIRSGQDSESAGVLAPLMLAERGGVVHVAGRAVAANLPREIADRMATRATEILREKGFDAEIEALRVGGKSTGAGVFFTVRYERAVAGFGALGRRGLPAERVALEACRAFFAFHKTGAAVDRHLADQLVLPMVLARGRSEMTIECVTKHLLTNAHVVRLFLPAKIEIEGEEGRPGRVVVEGVGR